MATNASASNIPEFHMGDRLRKALNYAGVSVEDMAVEVGVSTTTLGNYMALRTTPKRSVLAVWSLRTGVPIEWIENGTGSGGDGPNGPSEQDDRTSPCMTDDASDVVYLAAVA